MLNYVELVKAQTIKLKAFISIKIYNNEQNTIKIFIIDKDLNEENIKNYNKQLYDSYNIYKEKVELAIKDNIK